jgi:hypothetical protein
VAFARHPIDDLSGEEDGGPRAWSVVAGGSVGLSISWAGRSGRYRDVRWSAHCKTVLRAFPHSPGPSQQTRGEAGLL